MKKGGVPEKKNNGEAAALFEGNLRAMDQSTIEKIAEVPELQELLDCLVQVSERAGFEPAIQV